MLSLHYAPFMGRKYAKNSNTATRYQSDTCISLTNHAVAITIESCREYYLIARRLRPFRMAISPFWNHQNTLKPPEFDVFSLKKVVLRAHHLPVWSILCRHRRSVIHPNCGLLFRRMLTKSFYSPIVTQLTPPTTSATCTAENGKQSIRTPSSSR